MLVKFNILDHTQLVAEKTRVVSMNLSRMLAAREEIGRPVRVGLVGAGKFGTMFLAQARLTKGLHVLGIADLDVPRATKSCLKAGWSN